MKKERDSVIIFSMKNRINNPYSLYFFLALFLLLLPNLSLFPQDEDRQTIFQVNSKTYRVATRRIEKENKIDIMLCEGEVEHNLSRDLEGDNLYPGIEVHDDHFYISWINYHGENERLLFYDSSRECSLVLLDGDLKLIAKDRKIIFNDSFPTALIFKANQTGNYDLFGYSFITGEIKNITNTRANEKKFRVIINDEKKDRIIIESETLYHKYRYLFDADTLTAKRLEKVDLLGIIPAGPGEIPPEALNRYITYGDSITWGKMRMNNLPYDPAKEYHHPELAYPQKIKEKLDEDYGAGAVNYYNLSNPGENTFDGVARLDELASYRAKYFLLMFGTNDAYRKDFYLDDSLENMAFMIEAALNYKMDVIVSTIPPRNDSDWYDNPWVKPNIQAFNSGLIALTGQKNIRYIDTYTAFMNYQPPDGWKKLLEDRDATDIYKPGRGGQHPSPLGHQVITDLFIPKILASPPLYPQNIAVSRLLGRRIQIAWQPNTDFDISHYYITFGYFPTALNHFYTTSNIAVIFIRPPFPNHLQVRLYFYLQAVDSSGNKSDPTTIYTAIFK